MDTSESNQGGIVTAEVGRLCRVLEALVLLKKVKYREIDRLLGTSSGVTRRIFAGKIELKARHIFAILGYLKVEPKVFFRLAYEAGDNAAATPLDILAYLQRIGPLDAESTSLNRSEVEALVLSMLESRGLLPSSASTAEAPASPRKTKSRSRKQETP
jgi:hypothetical protein